MLIIVREMGRGSFQLRDVSPDATWSHINALIRAETGYVDIRFTYSDKKVFNPDPAATMEFATRGILERNAVVLTIAGHGGTETAFFEQRVAVRDAELAVMETRASQLENAVTAAKQQLERSGPYKAWQSLTARHNEELRRIQEHIMHAAALDKALQGAMRDEVERQSKAVTEMTERTAMKALLGDRSVADRSKDGACCGAPGCRSCKDGGASAK